MAEWWSIEVFQADLSARQWKSSYENALIEAALTHGALNWAWHEHRTGVVLEVEFTDDASLGDVPEPARRPGRAGRGAGPGERADRLPRARGRVRLSLAAAPRAEAGADALARPEPAEEKVLDLTEAAPRRW